jgi:hypothetical protein
VASQFTRPSPLYKPAELSRPKVYKPLLLFPVQFLGTWSCNTSLGNGCRSAYTSGGCALFPADTAQLPWAILGFTALFALSISLMTNVKLQGNFAAVSAYVIVLVP